MELSFHPLPEPQVRLLPGLFQKRYDVNQRYIQSLQSRNLLQNHYMEAGLWAPMSKPENIHWGWESPTCQIRGEFLGHWLSAAAHLIALTGDLELKGKADFIVAEVARCQVENGGEWAGPIPEKYMDWLARGKTVQAPHCTVHRNMMGLFDMYAWAGNQQALDILIQWARWFSRWTAQFSREQFDHILDVETGGMLEVWADLYGVTGEKEHYELIHRYDRRRLFDPLLAGKDVLTNKHANTTIPEIHGAARAWEVTREDRWRDIVEAYWRCAVTERGFFCTGGQTNGEFWIPPQQLSTRLGDKTQEYCTVYHMMRLAEYLLRWTGEAVYDDYWERNLYNGTLAQQHPDTGMVTYHLPMRSGSFKKWGTPMDDFWCCQGTLIQGHSVYPHHIFYADGNNLVLTQYIPCQIDWGQNGIGVSLTLSEDSHPEAHRRPHNRSYELKIDCAQPLEYTLKFRLPWWLNASPEVAINGEKHVVSGHPSTYAQIHRVWHHDKVQITLPKSLTTSPLPDLPDTVAFMDGPVVLAGVLENNPLRTEGKTFDERRGGGEALIDRTLFCKGEDPTSVLIPDNEREFTRWKIAYRTQDQAQNLRLIPLYEIKDESYAVYFPIKKRQLE
jgi:DUF1680 family protein